MQKLSLRASILVFAGSLALASGIIYCTWLAPDAAVQAQGGNLGTGQVTDVVPLDGGCSTLPTGTGTQSWNVQEGKMYRVTLSNVTECSGNTIGIIVVGSTTGNICLTATKVGTGKYEFIVPMPAIACCTYPIRYKCTADCSTSGSLFARRSDGNPSQAHLRAATFDSSCNFVSEDRDCGAAVSINTGPSTVECKSTNTYSANVTGLCSSPTYKWSITRDGTISGSDTGSSVTVVAGGACNGSFTLSVTITCGGGCQQPITSTKTVSVVDTTPPLITCPGDKTVECGSDTSPAATGSATATDNCSTPSVNKSDSFAPGCGNTGVITRTWTATDACGKTATCVQKITIVDTTAPVLSGCPTGNPTVQCLADVPPVAHVTATDNCDTTVEVTFEETQSNPGSSCNNVITRTWTAKDSCGNEATSCTQTITVNDTTKPVLGSCPGNIEVCEGQTVTFTTPTATDNCGGNVTVTCSPASGSTFEVGTTTVTCTATDSCGNNSDSCSFTVTVNKKPTCILSPPNPLPQCGSTGNKLTASVSGGTGPYTYSWTVSGNGTLTDGQGTDTITYNVGTSGDDVMIELTVTDAKGCSSTCSTHFGCVTPPKHCTLSQGFYGGGNPNAVTQITSLLNQGNLVIGVFGTRSITFDAADAKCIHDRMPATGTADALPIGLGELVFDSSMCPPNTGPLPINQQGNWVNVLLGQTVAMSLNVRLDPTLGSFVLPAKICTKGAIDDQIDPNSALVQVTIPALLQGLTVNQLIDEANKALAGQSTPASLTEITQALDAVITAFDGCRIQVACP